MCAALSLSLSGDVKATILIVSLEGEVSSLHLEDDFKVELDSSALGRKIDDQSILETGKDGSIGLLFSNGTLVAVKPSTKFYVREYSQRIFSPEGFPKPSELEEEPSRSQFLAHLDFGELVVKVPKLKKGSSMILSSPLGTAGIRGTMFQLMAVRNPITGDITGGLNLISGDVTFTDLEGREEKLVSGQSLHAATSQLGFKRAIQASTLLDLKSIYGPTLLGDVVPPTVEQLFPGASRVSGEDEDFSDRISMFPSPVLFTDSAGGWEVVHKVASEIFFDIETLEVQAGAYDFESMQYAVSVSSPVPPVQSLGSLQPLSSGGFSIPDPIDVLYLNPPVIEIHPGADRLSQQDLLIEYLVQRKNPSYPVSDHGPFKITSILSGKYPSYSSKAFDGTDLTAGVQVYNANAVDYSQLGQETKLTLYVDDLAVRKLSYPSGKPVSTTIAPTVRIVDNQKPIIAFVDGETQASPYLVTGVRGGVFVDPGISVLDNYYSENEIMAHMGYSSSLTESAFGSVDMGVAGVYSLTYQSISDPSGNIADSKTRWVQILDNEAPSITLYGSDPIYVDLNSSNVFKDPGAFANDNLDGVIEWESGRFEVVVEVLTDSGTQLYNQLTTTFEEVLALAKTQSSVNATFRFKYLVKDKAGNQSEASRQVVLLNSPFATPTIIMHGSNPHYHEVNTAFVDPGITAYKDMGSGVAPINLNDKVSAVAYSGTTISVIDSTVVNYDKLNGKYVDASGNEDVSKRIFIRYTVVDQFGNDATLDREVRIVDTTPPVVTLNDSGGANFLNIQTGTPFVDPGAVASDNYDSSSVVTKSIQTIPGGQVLTDPSGSEIFQSLTDRGFWDVGSYKIVYESVDANGNKGTAERSLVIQDTLAPDMAVISHAFMANPAIALNAYHDSSKAMISAVAPLPANISTALGQVAGYDYGLNSFNRTTPYVSEFGSSSDLYFKYTQLDLFDNSGTGMTTVEFQDAYGRSYVWHSAFKATVQGVAVQDPGVYVRNDSSLSVTVQSSVNKTLDQNGNPYKFFISYTATQSSGETSQISNARTIRFLDEEAPVLELSPATDGTNTFILAEGGVPYTDVAADAIPWQFGTKGSSETLITRAFDAVEEGAVTDKINRNIFQGYLTLANTTTGGAPVLRVDPITNAVKSVNEIGSAVSALIPTDISARDQIYTIRYDVTDSAENAANPALRYLVVKDTLPPVVALPPTQLVIVDSTSISNPDVRDEQSVKDYLISDMTAQDANNFDSNLTWSVTITKPNGQNTPPGGTGYDEPVNPGAASGIVFPIRITDPGYVVSITATDSSGNTSSPVTRELKIGDALPPTLTLMGKSVIHDFLRFTPNAGAPPVPPTHVDQITAVEYNASGFGSGEHRMLDAAYDFVDPGVYAEDENVNWSIDSGFPDWDGDGIGECYEFVKVTDRAEMESCTYQGVPTYLKIHVYSVLQTKTLQQMQNELNAGYGFTSSPKVPKTDNFDPVDGYAFTDSGKESNTSRLTNLNATMLTLEYRVMDGWGNLSNIVVRNVYVYQSSQYDQYAFFATPINGLQNYPSEVMETYFNDGTGTNYLTSFRKDTDGDGMSDYWEAVFQTDYKLPDPTHANPDWSQLNNLTPTQVRNRVQSTLLDASQLDDMNTNWINGSHILLGL